MNVPKEALQRLEAQARLAEARAIMERRIQAGPVIICPVGNHQLKSTGAVLLKPTESNGDAEREGVRFAEFMYRTACGSFMYAMLREYRRLCPRQWEEA